MASTTEPRGKGGILSYLLSFFLFLCIWQLLAEVAGSPLILPGPLAVLLRLFTLCKTRSFYSHLQATMGRVAFATAITFISGTASGILFGKLGRVRSILSVFLTAVRSVPVISFILMALLWLGSSDVPVFVAVVMTFPVMVTSVATGLSSVPRNLKDSMSCYQLAARQVFLHLTLPCLLPFIKEGALSSFGMIWKVVAAGEVLSLPKLGMGQLLYTAQVHLESTDLLAVTLAIVILSFSFERIAALIISRAERLMKETKRRRAMSASCNIEADGKLSRQSGHAPRIQLDGFSAVRGGKPLYKDFSLSFAPESSTAIIAPSGAGKTTLLSFIASLLRPADGCFSGHVRFDGKIPPGPACRAEPALFHLSFLFQDPCLLPSCTVYENVLIPLLNTMKQEDASQQALRFLGKCGLESKLAHFPDELSGGERQRAALARAFAFPSAVLLLDEPFQNQDLAQKISLMSLFGQLVAHSSRTVVLVTHDIKEALSCCSRVIVLKGSPVRPELDESLPDAGCPCTELYLSPDPERQDLERRISGILLGN